MSFSFILNLLLTVSIFAYVNNVVDAADLRKLVKRNTQSFQSSIVELKANNPGEVLKLPTKVVLNLDQEWILRSTPGSKITLECFLDLGSQIKPCDKDILTIDYGIRTAKFCKTTDMTIYSKENFASVRLQLSDTRNKAFQCNVYAVPVEEEQEIDGGTTTSEPQILIENIDSSEHGVTHGIKGTTCDCGRANKPKARIVNGNQAAENEFPWMAIIYTYYSDGKTVCGGSIITKRHVLTAAHCVMDRDKGYRPAADKVRLILGEYDLDSYSDNEIDIVGEKLYIHDEYLRKGSHDIAIIFTEESISFNRLIGPVCLTPVHLPIEKRYIQIMGWGQIAKGHNINQISNFLLKAKAEVLGNCNENKWEFCTRSNPSSTCYGDSGSPQVWVDPDTNRYTQVSIAARVFLGCGTGLNIQTDVVYFFDWIQRIIKESDSNQTICQKIN